jgi:hypothetical protein
MKFRDSLYYFLIILAIAFIIFVTVYIIKNKYAFFENPFVYGAYRMKGVDCSCVQIKDGKSATFSFNDTTFIRNRIIITQSFDKENFSEFIEDNST